MKFAFFRKRRLISRLLGNATLFAFYGNAALITFGAVLCVLCAYGNYLCSSNPEIRV